MKQHEATAIERRLKAALLKETSDELLRRLPPSKRRSVELAREAGASAWLSARPIEEHGFALHKSAFRDAMALRYGWDPQDLPSRCACGEVFNTCHALSCASGGFIISRHNERRDLTADLLIEVCNDVGVEPRLQPVSAHHVLPTSANRSD